MFSRLWKDLKEFFGFFEEAVKNVEKGPPNPPDLHDIVSSVGKEKPKPKPKKKTSKAPKKTPG